MFLQILVFIKILSHGWSHKMDNTKHTSVECTSFGSNTTSLYTKFIIKRKLNALKTYLNKTLAISLSLLLLLFLILLIMHLDKHSFASVSVHAIFIVVFVPHPTLGCGLS